ncbi:MAG: Mur ligase domain-containing protein, partial [Rhizobiaceae bacterium]|nr:Mur ligase domain-containing protein [Rhizobiaceae bacterium]
MSENGAELWSIEEFLAAIGGRPLGEMTQDVGGISIDTRTLEEGDAFFAIKGDRFDGHAFVTNAAGRGAAVAVVNEEKLVALGALNLPLVIVTDVLEAMERLAIAARARTKARIIAITGSVGKTTTKEMLRTLLTPCGKVHASIASYNNHWGVPLTLARMARDTKFGIFEIGMNHPGEITPLVKMVRPHGAVITTIGAAHLGAFKSLNDIARAKGEIFSGVESGGFALINRDIPQFSLLSKLADKAGIEHLLAFGEKRGAKFALKEVLPSSSGSHISARLDGKKVELDLRLPGAHMVSNLLAALGAASLAGADMEKVLGAVNLVGAVKGRGQGVM